MLKDASESIEVSTGINDFARELFWGGISISVSSGRVKTVSIAATQVDEFHIVANAGDEDVLRLQNRYLELKKAIAAANADISAQLTEMLVVRAEKEFYERLECKEISSFDEWEDMADGSRIRRPVNTPYDAYIDEAKRREMVESLEERLDSLQDEVDAFNATHTLEVAM